MDKVILEDSQDSDRRICHRTQYQRRIMIELENGIQLDGISQDISLKGVALEIYPLPEGIRMGLNGQLFLIDSSGSRSTGFNCSIAHIRKNNIGIEIDKKVAAKFGICLSKNLFKRKGNGE